MRFGDRYKDFRVLVWFGFGIGNKLNPVNKNILMKKENEILIKEFECLIYVFWVWWRLMNVDEGVIEDDEEEEGRR